MSDMNPDNNRDTFQGRGHRIKELEEENKLLNNLLKELNEVCGWKDESALHAILHINNFVTNLKTEAKVEKKLRLMLIKKLENLIEEQSR